MSIFRTGVLLAGLTALFLVVGYLIGGEAGMLIALGFAVMTNMFAYFSGDKVVLRMYGAREVDRRSAPGFYGIVEQLAAKADLPMPRVYTIENDQPNAFATGRSPAKASVAVTTGLLARLDYEEIAGVMAHELAHVRNRDTLTMTITATVAGAISMLASMAMFAGMFGGGNRNNPLGFVGVLLVALLAPMAAMLVQMAISRTREFAADRAGAEICGHPLWLARALEKLERGAQSIDNAAAERNPATAHLFIVNPLHAQALNGLISTHPKMAERIRRLREMAGEAGRSAGPWG